MRELALHLLDIAHNSVSAGARHILMEVREDSTADRLILRVRDDGKGMDAATVAMVTDAFTTSRTERKVGLGIPLLKDAAEMCNGSFSIHSEVGKGTLVEAIFQRSHIDRMPLGDLAGTYLSLLIGCPQVNWHFIYQVDEQIFDFDDYQVKHILEGVDLCEPSILDYLRNHFRDGIESLQTELNPA